MPMIVRFSLFVVIFGYISAAAPERKVSPTPVQQPLDEDYPTEALDDLTRESDADKFVQSIADRVKAELIKQLGPGKVTMYKAIRYRRRTISIPPGLNDGRTTATVYYIKVEISPGKYVHENLVTGRGSTVTLERVIQNKTLQDEIMGVYQHETWTSWV